MESRLSVMMLTQYSAIIDVVNCILVERMTPFIKTVLIISVMIVALGWLLDSGDGDADAGGTPVRYIDRISDTV